MGIVHYKLLGEQTVKRLIRASVGEGNVSQPWHFSNSYIYKALPKFKKWAEMGLLLFVVDISFSGAFSQSAF